jgi:hypothetical protein
MKSRTLALIGLSILFCFTVSADCVNCPNSSCIIVYGNGDGKVVNDTPICGYEPANDKGYENCRDVDCHGCIGGTCTTRDPQVMQKVKLLKLLSTEISHTPAKAKH